MPTGPLWEYRKGPEEGAPGSPGKESHPTSQRDGVAGKERLSVGAGNKKLHTLTSAHSPVMMECPASRPWRRQKGEGYKNTYTDRGPRNGDADPRMSAEWLHILGGAALEDLEARGEPLPSNSSVREQ